MTLSARILVVLVVAGIGVAAGAEERPNSSVIEEKIKQAHALQDKGSLAQAKAIYDSLLPALQSQPPSPQLGLILNDLSQIALAEGDYDLAVKNAQQAAKVYQVAQDKEGGAHAFNNKGIAEINQGDYVSAQSDLEQALRMSRTAADKENEIQILNNLGSAFFYRGMYSEALTNYEQAMHDVHGSADQPWNAYWNQITNFNEATLYQRLGRYERALDIYKQVESSKTLESSDRGHLFANLGTLYRRLGDPWKALATFRASTELYKKKKDADGELSVLKDTGIVYALDLGDLIRAEQIFRRALSLAQNAHNQRQEMQSHLYLGETLLRRSASKSARSEFEVALKLSKELSTKEEQWKALYGLGRVEEMSANPSGAERDYRDAIAIIESTRAKLQFANLRAEFLADKRDVYDDIIRLLLDRNDVPGAFSFLERSRARTFQDRLQLGDRGASIVPTIDALRARLNDSSLVLDFWVADNQLAAIWFDHNSYGSLQKQLSVQEMRDIRHFLQNLPANFNGSWREASRILGRIMPDGLTPVPANIKHLLIVPDGWLGSVPFDLLPTQNGPNSLLVENYDISYLPTALLLQHKPLRPAKFYFPWARELVAFGDPVIHERGSLEGDDGEPHSSLQLPHSAEEIRRLRDMVHGRKQVFLGSADSKRMFLSGKAKEGFLLHISTHAVADGDNPENSRLLFSSSNTNSAEYVFLREMYDVTLNGVSLATISACDTERGKLIRGEGVQAFSRALLSAGAQSSLTTLWRVQDGPTAEFMNQFYYFALQQRLPRAEALRRAKLKFLKSSFQSPEYWAAFVLSGDGMQPLPRVISWTELASWVVIGSVAILLFVGLLRRRRGLHRKHDARSAISQKA